MPSKAIVGKVTNIETAEQDTGSSSFAPLLARKETNALRDTWMLIKPEQGGSERLTLGYCIIYPGCRTNGHSHDDREEVYFVTRGKGIARVGDVEFEVAANDSFYLPPGEFHSMTNPYKEPLEHVWVTAAI